MAAPSGMVAVVGEVVVVGVSGFMPNLQKALSLFDKKTVIHSLEDRATT